MAKDKTFTARPMNNVSEFNSEVDIIIPYHGQYEKVMELLESILRLTRSNYFNICIVDDCSPNETFLEAIAKNSAKSSEKLKQKNIIKTVRSETQLGFGGACRLGFENTQSPYVCFINSDCRIEDSGWLRKLGETLLNLKSQGVRMVSPMTDNPVNGDPAQKGEQFARSVDDSVVGDDSYLSLYCFMCHRLLFSKIGGFLKEYPYGGYEDEEIAHRMRKHGFKQAVCRSSWIYHEGGATIQNLLRAQPNLRTVLNEENRKRCIEDMKRCR